MEAIVGDEAANILWRHAKGVWHIDRKISRAPVSPVLAVHDSEDAPSKKRIFANVGR
jgi:hypothetical protein